MFAWTRAVVRNSLSVSKAQCRLYASGKAKKRGPHPTVKYPLTSDMMMRNTMDFLYGMQPVLAALSQGTRQIYGLYVQHQREGDAPAPERMQALELAARQDIPVKHVPRDLLDRMSLGNLHQGIVLKADQLAADECKQLGPLADSQYWVEVQTTRTQLTPQRPFPLWVLVDRVQDPRNLGSIVRSAAFFGADGLVASRKDSCVPNAVVAKASAGALEATRFLRCRNVDRFVEKSRENGWLVVSAAVGGLGDPRVATVGGMGEIDRPVLLVLGNEGGGVRSSVLDMSHVLLSIPMRSELPRYLDSLNVGVAAGVILSSLRFKGEES
ncbi:Ribose methyltransferase [Linderina pennispora]|nr:Ribose methyltransferase [Linderina pennispora]